MVTTICVLKTVAFLDLIGVSLLLPLISLHARNLGANHVQVGLMGSIYAIFQLISQPLLGSLSDLKGRKPILVGTILACSITYIIFGFVTSITTLLCLRAVLGIFKQTQTLVRALVPDYVRSDKEQQALYGKMAAVSGAGMTLGPLIGGRIIEEDPEYGFRVIGLGTGFAFALNAALVYFLLPETKKTSARRKGCKRCSNLLENTISSLKESVLQLYKINWAAYWQIFVLKAFISIAMGLYFSNYALYLSSVFNLTPKYVGYVISFQGVIGVTSSYFIGYINSFYPRDKDFSQRNLHVMVIMTLAFLGMISSTNFYMYLACLIPLAIGNSVQRLVNLTMILNKSHNEHRGSMIGASNSVRSLTGVFSPMLAGVIGEYIGPVYVIHASLIATAFGAVISYQIHMKRKRD